MQKRLILSIASGLWMSFGSLASAQVIFEPVQYQWGANPSVYCGSCDARVFDYAARTEADGLVRPTSGRYSVGTTYRGRIGEPPRVFSSYLPYVNAALFGYTPADARNEANADVPCYFRKIDLLRSAVPLADGKTFAVPAQAPLIDIRPYHRPMTGRPTLKTPATAPATTPAQPSSAPAPVLIIPRPPIQPLSKLPDHVVASAASMG